MTRSPRIPITRFSGFLKQLAVSELSREGIAVLDLSFPEFLREKERMVPYEMFGISQIYTSQQPRPVGWGRLRRYAGSPTLGPGRYHAVCTRPDGFDGGTLQNELMTYWSEETMVWPGLRDSTLLSDEERAKYPDLVTPELGIHLIAYRRRTRGRRRATVEKVAENRCVLPLAVRQVDIDGVLDLRLPETQTWFFEHFTRMEEELGSAGQRTQGGVEVKTYKYHKVRDFVELLPTLVAPPIGGSSFHQGVGAWLRSHDIQGLVYPSARCDASWQVLSDSRSSQSGRELTIAFSGWNFVDYRGAGAADWAPLFGRLSTWVMPMKAGILVTRLDGAELGWSIDGAEEGERNRVAVARDLMMGRIAKPPDWDPRGGFRRPYYPRDRSPGPPTSGAPEGGL